MTVEPYLIVENSPCDNTFLKRVALRDLPVEDPFFDSLRLDYREFDEWYKKVSSEGRLAWIVSNKERIDALCIYKIETVGERITNNYQITKGSFLKLCTFKVSDTGCKYGETLLNEAIHFAVEHKLEAVYVQIREGRHGELVDLIQSFGFESLGYYRMDISYVKYIRPDLPPRIAMWPDERFEYARKHFPYHLDDSGVKKFVVTLSQSEHDALFFNYHYGALLLHAMDKPIKAEANAIQKIFANRYDYGERASAGDLLFFYKKDSGAENAYINGVGVVQDEQCACKYEEIRQDLVRRMSITEASFARIKGRARGVIIVRFWMLQYFQRPIFKNYLRNMGDGTEFSGVKKISHDDYLTYLKSASRFGIDKSRFEMSTDENMMDIAVILLTKNEEAHIERCLDKLKLLAVRQLFVVDSQSSDRTLAIAKRYGAAVAVHEWPGDQAKQFNWALDNLAIDTEWVLRLDADEWLTDDLIAEIKDKLSKLTNDIDGVVLKRRHYVGWLGGKWIKHGMYPTRIMRLFRTGRARYAEDMTMDEHLVVQGRTIELDNDFVDESLISFEDWKEKHRGYAKREAQMAVSGNVNPNKRAYYRLPPYFRAFAYFCIRYFLKLGFLDGLSGFRWHFWQGLWYRILVDREITNMKSHSKVRI